MNVFRDGVIAFFSAVGMTTVVWLLAGAVLHAGRPTIPGLLLVLPVRGSRQNGSHRQQPQQKWCDISPAAAEHPCQQYRWHTGKQSEPNRI